MPDHNPSSLILLYGGASDIAPMIRKPVPRNRESEIYGLVTVLVAVMNTTIGRSDDTGIPVIPFYTTPRPITAG